VLFVFNDGSIQVSGGYRLQAFEVGIYNNAGTLQHRIYDDLGNIVANNYTGLVNGAASGLNNTPSVNNTTGFTAGAGINAGATNRLVLDVPAQVRANVVCLPVPVYNDTGTAVYVDSLNMSTNVNGVTRVRPELYFTTGAGAAFALTAANIPNGKQIAVKLIAFLTP
jgi:hypothetical protein